MIEYTRPFSGINYPLATDFVEQQLSGARRLASDTAWSVKDYLLERANRITARLSRPTTPQVLHSRDNEAYYTTQGLLEMVILLRNPQVKASIFYDHINTYSTYQNLDPTRPSLQVTMRGNPRHGTITADYGDQRIRTAVNNGVVSFSHTKAVVTPDGKVWRQELPLQHANIANFYDALQKSLIRHQAAFPTLALVKDIRNITQQLGIQELRTWRKGYDKLTPAVYPLVNGRVRGELPSPFEPPLFSSSPPKIGTVQHASKLPLVYASTVATPIVDRHVPPMPHSPLQSTLRPGFSQYPKSTSLGNKGTPHQDEIMQMLDMPWWDRDYHARQAIEELLRSPSAPEHRITSDGTHLLLKFPRKDGNIHYFILQTLGKRVTHLVVSPDRTLSIASSVKNRQDWPVVDSHGNAYDNNGYILLPGTESATDRGHRDLLLALWNKATTLLEPRESVHYPAPHPSALAPTTIPFYVPNAAGTETTNSPEKSLPKWVKGEQQDYLELMAGTLGYAVECVRSQKGSTWFFTRLREITLGGTTQMELCSLSPDGLITTDHFRLTFGARGTLRFETILDNGYVDAIVFAPGENPIRTIGRMVDPAHPKGKNSQSITKQILPLDEEPTCTIISALQELLIKGGTESGVLSIKELRKRREMQEVLASYKLPPYEKTLAMNTSELRRSATWML